MALSGEQVKKIAPLKAVLNITEITPEYAGTPDVDEFTAKLKLFNELAQPCNFKTQI